MIKPSRIRFDDILVKSSDKKIQGKELQKFLKNIRWCQKTNAELTPAILCQDIEQIPEAAITVRNMTKEGIISPILHGWDHGDYGSRTQKEIEEHLDKSLHWFKNNLKVTPKIWATPHGADSPEIREAAVNLDLVVETTKFPVIDINSLEPRIRKTRDLTIIQNSVIMTHFWNAGLRLYRIAKIIEHQGIENAKRETKKELDKKSYQICWEAWG